MAQRELIDVNNAEQGLAETETVGFNEMRNFCLSGKYKEITANTLVVWKQSYNLKIYVNLIMMSHSLRLREFSSKSSKYCEHIIIQVCCVYLRGEKFKQDGFKL